MAPARPIHLRRAALALAAAALSLAAWPAGAGRAKSAPSICEGLAERVRALPSAQPRPAGDDPIQRLAARAHPYLRLDRSEAVDLTTQSRMDQFLTSLRHHYRVGGRLIGEMAPDGFETHWLRRFGASNLYAFEQMGGTLHCASFVFFKVTPGRAARPAPAVSKDGAEATEFCGADQGFVGAIGGTPVFIESKWAITDPDHDVTVWAWRRSRWSRPCRIEVSHKPIYHVSELHCRGEACDAVRRAAPGLAASRERRLKAHNPEAGPDGFSWGRPIPLSAADKVARMQALFDTSASMDVPTLGDPSDDPQRFATDNVSFPVVLNNAVYLGVLSHRTLGWRQYPDFLLGVYDLRDGALDPVAGARIGQSEGSLASIRVSAR